MLQAKYARSVPGAGLGLADIGVCAPYVGHLSNGGACSKMVSLYLSSTCSIYPDSTAMATNERQAAEFALLASMYANESRLLPPLQADTVSQGATLALDLQRTSPHLPSRHAMPHRTATLAEAADQHRTPLSSPSRNSILSPQPQSHISNVRGT